MLDALRAFVDGQVVRHGCDHTHRFTRQWAERESVDWDDLLDVLEHNGGFCDCEVVLNLPEDMDLDLEPNIPAPSDGNRWRIPLSFEASAADSFDKMLVCDANLGRNTYAEPGEILVPAPKGAKPRKRVRRLVHFFIGCSSGLPAEIGVVAPCEATSAEAFAKRVMESGLEDFKGFTQREAAFLLSRLSSLAPGTPVGTHFMETSGVVGKHEELRVHKVMIRR